MLILAAGANRLWRFRSEPSAEPQAPPVAGLLLPLLGPPYMCSYELEIDQAKAPGFSSSSSTAGTVYLMSEFRHFRLIGRVVVGEHFIRQARFCCCCAICSSRELSTDPEYRGRQVCARSSVHLLKL
jgi:hypothetical protein